MGFIEFDLETIRPYLIKGFLGFCLVMVIAGFFYLGGYMACSNGEGELISEGNLLLGMKCTSFKETGVCNIGGDKFKVPEIETPINITK